MRNLFDQNDDDDDDVYEGIEYLFDESIMYYSFKNSGLEYEEIKKLLSVKSKTECIKYIITDGIIEQEEAIDYDVNYYRANYRRCDKVKEIYCIKYKTFLVKGSSDYTIDYEPIKYFESVNDKKVEFCEIIQDQKVEFCVLIENQKVETSECKAIIEDQKVETIECKAIIEDQKVEIIECEEIIEDQKVEIIECEEIIEDQKVEKFSKNGPKQG